MANASLSFPANNDRASPETAEIDATIPIAFCDQPQESALREEDLHEIEAVREEFIDLVGEAGDPASPEYHRRWQNAQRQTDDELAADLVSEAFSEQQLEAVLAQQAPSRKGN